MRLFVAIDLPSAYKDRLEALKAPLPGARWVQRQAFHLTLRFLGDGIPADRLDDIRAALAAIQAERFDMSLRGVGQFSGKVLWVGVEAPPALYDLHHALGMALRDVGFPPDARRFSPHITLARLRDDRGRHALSALLERYAGFTTAPFVVTAFTLYASQLTANGPIYTAQAAYALH